MFRNTFLASIVSLGLLASAQPANAQAEGIGETIAVIGAAMILGSETYYRSTGKTLSDAVCSWPLGSANAGCVNGKAKPIANSVGYVHPGYDVVFTLDGPKQVKR